MVYETAGRRAARALGAIRTALGDAEGLVLATDPDREGEAIAWQVLTWLREKDALGGKPVERVAFREITAEGCARRWRGRAAWTWSWCRRSRRAARSTTWWATGVAAYVAQGARLPVGRTGAVGGAAPRLRARGRDRGVRSAGILDR